MQQELTPKQKYKKHFMAVLPMILVFIIASIISLSLGLFSTDILLLSVPFILIPFLFAMQVNTADVESGTQFSNKGVWNAFKRYLFGPFNGCYNVINAFFKTVLFSLVVSLIFTLVFTSIAQAVSPTINETVENVMNMIQSGVTFGDITTALSDSPEFVYTLLAIQVFEGLFFTVTFTSYILGSAPYALVQGVMGPREKRVTRMVYNATRKSNRGLYNKNYLKFAWPTYLLIVFGFFIGIALTMLVLLKTEVVYLDDPVTMFNGVIFAIPMGVLGSVLSLSFYLPYFFFSVEEFAFDLMPAIRETSIKIAMRNVEELKRLNQLNEEEARAYEEDIKRAQETELNLDDDDNDDIS